MKYTYILEILIQKMVCHGEHTYLYSQVLMHILAQEIKGGSNIRRLCQELQKSAQARSVDNWKEGGKEKGKQVSKSWTSHLGLQ